MKLFDVWSVNAYWHFQLPSIPDVFVENNVSTDNGILTLEASSSSYGSKTFMGKMRWEEVSALCGSTNLKASSAPYSSKTVKVKIRWKAVPSPFASKNLKACSAPYGRQTVKDKIRWEAFLHAVRQQKIWRRVPHRMEAKLLKLGKYGYSVMKTSPARAPSSHQDSFTIW